MARERRPFNSKSKHIDDAEIVPPVNPIKKGASRAPINKAHLPAQIGDPKAKKKKEEADLIKKVQEAKIKNDALAKERENREKIAEVLRTHTIDQVVLHAKEYKDKGRLTFASDLDSRLFVYILENFNKKSKVNADGTENPEGLGEIYSKDAIHSIISKGGTLKDLETTKNTGEIEKGEKTYPERKGVIVSTDVGNTWLEYEEDGENKILTFDHHGRGRKEPTCAAKDLYEIMEEENLLRENPQWLRDFVKFTTELDNLSFVNETNAKGEKILNKEYFLHDFPRSMRGIGQDVPFEILLGWYQSGKYKEYLSRPFTREELRGELGKTSWVTGTKMVDDGKGGQIEIEVKESIAKLCEAKKEQAEDVIRGLENCISWSKASGLAMEKTRLGKIIFQNYFMTMKEDGTKGPNTVPIQNGMAFLGTQALGYDTFIEYNKKNKIFGINSNEPELETVGEEMEEEIQGIQNIRGTWLMAPREDGWMKKSTDRGFLDLVDKEIAKKVKPIGVFKVQKNPEFIKKMEDKKIINEKIYKLEEEKGIAEKNIRTFMEKEKTIEMQLDEISAKIEKIRLAKATTEAKVAEPAMPPAPKEPDSVKENTIQRIKDKIKAKMLGKDASIGKLSAITDPKMLETVERAKELWGKNRSVEPKEESEEIKNKKAEIEANMGTENKVENLISLADLKIEMEKNIGKLLENEELKDKEPEILEYDLVKTQNGFEIKSKIKLNKTGSFFVPEVTITLNLPFENKNGELTLGKEFIDTDSSMATGKIKKKLMPVLPTMIPSIKTYFEKQLGRKINSMTIEDGGLKLK